MSRPTTSLRVAKAALALHVRKRRQKPEQQLHKAVADFLRVALVPPAFFTTFPAGGGGKARGGQLKAMGLMPGMPDLFVFWQGEQWTGPQSRLLYPRIAGIELKWKGPVSREQVACHEAFAKIAAMIAICRSIDDVKAALAFWGVPHRVVSPSPVVRPSFGSESTTP